MPVDHAKAKEYASDIDESMYDACPNNCNLAAAYLERDRQLEDVKSVLRGFGHEVPGWIKHDGRKDELTLDATLLFILESYKCQLAELRSLVDALLSAEDDIMHDGSTDNYEPAVDGLRNWLKENPA